MSTTSRQVNFEDFEAVGHSANLVVRLMMACNDASISNQCLEGTRSSDHGYADDRTAHAAAMYFVRTQLSHLFEGIKIVQDVRSDAFLMSILARCDSRTKSSFDYLVHFCPGEPKESRIQKILGQLRHNVGFHYHESGKWIGAAISERAKDPKLRFSRITRGSHAYKWRFHLADEVVETIVIRKIWEIPNSMDALEESNKITAEINELFLAFVDFCGEFIWKFCEK